MILCMLKSKVFIVSKGAAVAWWLEHWACNPQVLRSNSIKVLGDDRKSIRSQLILCLKNYNPAGQG